MLKHVRGFEKLEIALGKAYRIINKSYFGNALPPNMEIKVVYDDRKMNEPAWQTRGHFVLQNEMDFKNSDLFPETFNIYLNSVTKSMEELCGIICHICVHYYMQSKGIRDTGKNNGNPDKGKYHTQAFGEMAEKCGLVVLRKDDNNGYGITVPSEEFKDLMRVNRINKPEGINYEKLKHSINSRRYRRMKQMKQELDEMFVDDQDPE